MTTRNFISTFSFSLFANCPIWMCQISKYILGGSLLEINEWGTAIFKKMYSLQVIVPHVSFYGVASVCDLKTARPGALEHYSCQILKQNIDNIITEGQ